MATEGDMTWNDGVAAIAAPDASGPDGGPGLGANPAPTTRPTTTPRIATEGSTGGVGMDRPAMVARTVAFHLMSGSACGSVIVAPVAECSEGLTVGEDSLFHGGPVVAPTMEL